MCFHFVECEKVKITSSRQVDGGYLGWEVGKKGRCWSKGIDLSCKMSASLGGVCSMLTVVNPVLLEV